MRKGRLVVALLAALFAFGLVSQSFAGPTGPPRLKTAPSGLKAAPRIVPSRSTPLRTHLRVSKTSASFGPIAGQTITVTGGLWSGQPTFYQYQWRTCDVNGQNCVNVAGATCQNSTGAGCAYTVSFNAVSGTLDAVVTATNQYGTGSTATAPTGVVTSPPVNTALPVVSGTATQGSTLSVTSGTWSYSPSFAYQWQDCDTSGQNCQNIGGATSTTYLLAASDVGHTIVVAVTATNATGTAQASSARTTVVAGSAPTGNVTPVLSLTGTTLNWPVDSNATDFRAQITGVQAPTTITHPSGFPITGYGYPLTSIVVTPAKINDAIVVAVGTAVNPISNQTAMTVSCSCVSGGSMSQIQDAQDVTDSATVSLWWGVATSTSAATVSVTGLPSSATDYNSLTVDELSAAGANAAWVADTSGTFANTSGTTFHYPSLTPTQSSGEAYWGFAESAGVLSGGTTPLSGAPFTYQALGDGSRMVTLSTQVANGTAYQPSATVASSWALTAGVVFYATAPTVTYQDLGNCGVGGAACTTSGGVNSWAPAAQAGQTITYNVASEGSSGELYSANPQAITWPAPQQTTHLSSSTVPTISGRAGVGLALTAYPQNVAATSYAYQWKDCNYLGASCSNVAGATNATYTVQAGDVGSTLEVSVTPSGGSPATSDFTSVVATCTQTISSGTDPIATLNAMSAGQTLCLNSGSYATAGTEYVTNGGASASAPTTITTTPGQAPATITGGVSIGNPGTSTTNNVTFNWLNMAENNTIANGRNTPGNGCSTTTTQEFSWNGSNVRLEDDEFYQTTPQAQRSSAVFGPYPAIANNGTLIRNNRIFQYGACNDYDHAVYDEGNGTTIRNNWIYNPPCSYGQNGGDTSKGCGSGVQMYVATTSDTVADNVIDGVGIGTNICCTTNTVSNNSFTNLLGWYYDTASPSYQTPAAYDGVGGNSTNTFSNNNYFNAGALCITGTCTATATGNTQSNPLFSDPTYQVDRDYRLSLGSPLTSDNLWDGGLGPVSTSNVAPNLTVSCSPNCAAATSATITWAGDANAASFSTRASTAPIGASNRSSTYPGNLTAGSTSWGSSTSPTLAVACGQTLYYAVGSNGSGGTLWANQEVPISWAACSLGRLKVGINNMQGWGVDSAFTGINVTYQRISVVTNPQTILATSLAAGVVPLANYDAGAGGSLGGIAPATLATSIVSLAQYMNGLLGTYPALSKMQAIEVGNEVYYGQTAAAYADQYDAVHKAVAAAGLSSWQLVASTTNLAAGCAGNATSTWIHDFVARIAADNGNESLASAAQEVDAWAVHPYGPMTGQDACSASPNGFGWDDLPNWHAIAVGLGSTAPWYVTEVGQCLGTLFGGTCNHPVPLGTVNALPQSEGVTPYFTQAADMRQYLTDVAGDTRTGATGKYPWVPAWFWYSSCDDTTGQFGVLNRPNNTACGQNLPTDERPAFTQMGNWLAANGPEGISPHAAPSNDVNPWVFAVFAVIALGGFALMRASRPDKLADR